MKATGNGWTLYNADWRDVLDEIGRVSHVISDPPFTDYVSENQRTSDSLGNALDKFSLSFGGVEPSDLLPLVDAAERWSVLFCAVEQIGDYAKFAQYVRTGIFLKKQPTPQFSGDRPAQAFEAFAVFHSLDERKRWNGGGKAGVYRYSRAKQSERFHETQKPLGLMIEIIEDFTDPDDLVFDPFAGSATTGAAALFTGRRFVGCEIQEHYFTQATERLRAAERKQQLSDYESGQEILF